MDFHTADIFAQNLFKLVVVLKSDNTVLYDRLVARGYEQIKIKENIECEIF